MTIRPLSDLIVVDRAPAETKTAGGLILPGIAQEQLHHGRVIAVGPGKRLPNGTRIPMELNEGDTVYFSKFEHMPFKVDGVEYVTMHEADVVGVLAG